MASGTAAGALAAWSGVYIDLNPGTPGEGWLAAAGCPGQPILTSHGLTLQKMDLAEQARSKEQVWAPGSQDRQGAAAPDRFLIILSGP